MVKNSSVPMRKCCGCMQSKPKSELIRICGGAGKAFIDMEDKGSGRGAYLCKDEKCLEAAQKKRGIQRSLRCDVKPDVLEKLFEEARKLL